MDAVADTPCWPEVFRAFLRLGLTSFGGPVAHLGYFRTEFVARRGWLSESAYAELVGLCQFLPGPASSQVGFAIGLQRAGLPGALAAWAGFTLPSAALLVGFAAGAPSLAHTRTGAGLLHGLQLVAVAIVAQAVLGMARSLCPDRRRVAIGLAALAAVTAAPVGVAQVATIVAAAALGVVLCRGDGACPEAAEPARVSRRLGAVCLALFAVLLIVPPLLPWPPMPVFAAVYRSGALVFGGGHVVLPLLHDAVVLPGWVSEKAFLAGYGAAQAMPGPLFTFAAYLGAVLRPGPGGPLGALLPVVAIFLPGLLLLLGVLPFWAALRMRPAVRAAMRGANAGVVGLLGAAMYDPVWTGSVHRPADFVLAACGFVLLVVWHMPPLAVVALGALGGVCLTL